MKKVLIGVMILSLAIGLSLADGINPLQVMKIVSYNNYVVSATAPTVITPNISGYITVIAHSKIYVDPTSQATPNTSDVPVLANTSLSMGAYIGNNKAFSMISDSGNATVNIIIRNYTK